MKLVPDVGQAHRWWSVRLAFLGAVYSVAQVLVPNLIGYINPLDHPKLYATISFGFFAATLAARLVDQKDVASE